MPKNIEKESQVDTGDDNLEEVFRDVVHGVGMWRNASCLRGISFEIHPDQTEVFKLLNDEPPFKIGITPKATKTDIAIGLHILVTQVNVAAARSAIGKMLALRREKKRVKDYARELRSYRVFGHKVIDEERDFILAAISEALAD